MRGLPIVPIRPFLCLTEADHARTAHTHQLAAGFGDAVERRAPVAMRRRA
jgi:hypothetical protein